MEHITGLNSSNRLQELYDLPIRDTFAHWERQNTELTLWSDLGNAFSYKQDPNIIVSKSDLEIAISTARSTQDISKPVFLSLLPDTSRTRRERFFISWSSGREKVWYLTDKVLGHGTQGTVSKAVQIYGEIQALKETQSLLQEHHEATHREAALWSHIYLHANTTHIIGLQPLHEAFYSVIDNEIPCTGLIFNRFDHTLMDEMEGMD